MNNTVVLKDRAYVEKKQSKKTWMDRVKKYFQGKQRNDHSRTSLYEW